MTNYDFKIREFTFDQTEVEIDVVSDRARQELGYVGLTVRKSDLPLWSAHMRIKYGFLAA
jgi:hypothetical protein